MAKMGEECPTSPNLAVDHPDFLLGMRLDYCFAEEINGSRGICRLEDGCCCGGNLPGVRGGFFFNEWIWVIDIDGLVTRELGGSRLNGDTRDWFAFLHYPPFCVKIEQDKCCPIIRDDNGGGVRG